MNIREKVNTIVERFKTFARDLKFKYQNIPPERKLAVNMFIIAGAILVIGSLFIIITTVFDIETQSERSKQQNYYTELEAINEKIEETIQDYSYDDLDGQRTEIDADFDKYQQDLDQIRDELQQINLPVSAPINE